MASSKKRKLHTCKKHPRVTARGRCTKCGSWICNECAVLFHGQFYCAVTCFPGTQVRNEPTPEPVRAAPLIADPVSTESAIRAEPVAVTSLERKPSPVSPTIAKPVFSWRRNLILWFTVTIALCSCAFALWEFRELRVLRHENAQLQEKRLQLIALLRKSNRDIAELKKTPPDTSVTPVPGAVSLPPLPPSRSKPQGGIPAADLNGIPLTFNNGSPDKPLVALTFDGGSNANAAADILDTLRSRNVKATMFLTGQFIRKFPDVTRTITEEGHEIGNHTLSHDHFTTWATDRTHTLLPHVHADYVKSQLSSVRALYRQVTGREMSPLWRIPYGEYNASVCAWARSFGHLHVGWRQGRTWRQGLDSNDWIPDEHTPGFKRPQEVMDKILAIAETKPYGINGGIILMHLGTERSQPDMQVHYIIGALIDSLRERGHTFVTISELAREAGVDMTKLDGDGMVRPVMDATSTTTN
jgi:peptidoglycan/xylan/chitin deacetylase (PgdA/CDA1 family)